MMLEVILSYLWQTNLVLATFILYFITIFILFLASLSQPLTAILSIAKYGKLKEKSSSNNGPCSILWVPKRWFCHFYVLSSTLSLIACYIMYAIYFKNLRLPHSIQYFLDFATTPNRSINLDASTAAVAMSLFTCHVFKRLYENYFISVFSSGVMHICHYIVGVTHYIGCVILLVAYAPGFQSREVPLQFSVLSLIQYCGILIYLMGAIMQHDSLRKLANLRKKRKDKENYLAPSGGLFEYVSCPHMFGEILVYVGFSVLLGIQHLHWLVVLLWVCANQTYLAVENHKWYKNKFKDYPRKRKALIPFLL